MSAAIDTPWKITNRFFSLLVYPYVRLLFAMNNIPWGQDWRFYGIPIIQKHRKSSISFGPGLQLRSSVRSNPLGPDHPVMLVTWEEGAILEVGKNFAMSGGVLCAGNRITIGNNVVVGANTIFVDTDFHPLDSEMRRLNPANAQPSPVVIEDNVFIGMTCMILKGVTIGTCSVIGAGSLVTHSVPPYTIAAGNPARPVRDLTAQFRNKPPLDLDNRINQPVNILQEGKMSDILTAATIPGRNPMPTPSTPNGVMVGKN